MSCFRGGPLFYFCLGVVWTLGVIGLILAWVPVSFGADKVLVPNYYGFPPNSTDGSYRECVGYECRTVIPNNGVIDFRKDKDDTDTGYGRRDVQDVPWKK